MPLGRAKVRFSDPQIEMAHGAGGKASRRLIEGLFVPLLFGGSSEVLGDAAQVQVNGSRVAITTDSFVVKPLSFPGGSIGELAVNGTVNDLAVSGARPEALVVTFVLEAGLATEILEAEVRAMARAAAEAGVTHRGRRYEGGRARQSRPDVHDHGGYWPAAAGDTDRSAQRSSRRQGPALRPHWRSRHHHSAGARRTGSRRRPAVGYAFRVSSGRSAGGCRGRRGALDARSYAGRRGYVLERTGARLRAWEW